MSRIPHASLSAWLLPAVMALPLVACNTSTQGGSSPLATADDSGADVVITSQPQAQSVSAGQTATFSVSAVDNKGRTLMYQWLENNAVISGATASSYTFTPTASDNNASFSVVVTDQNGCLQSLYSSGTPDSDGKRCIVSSSAPLVVSTATGLTTLAGNIGGPGNLNGTGSNARFAAAIGIAVNASGTVYVGDSGNSSIRAITPGGTVSTLAGVVDIPGFANGTGNAASFNSPWAITLDASGNIYAADSNNNAIRKITPAGVVSTYAAFVHGSYGPCVNTLTNSGGITFDHAGNIVLSNEGCHSVTIVSPSGIISNTYGSSAYFGTPEGVAVDSHGNIFVADITNQDIVKIDTTGNYSVFAGTVGTQGGADGTGTAASFYAPYGLTIDSNDNLYVAELGNNTVRKITSAGVVTTIAGSAGVSGSADGTGASARFYRPQGITVDTAGNLYVNDSANDTVRKITPAGVVTTLAGLAAIIGHADGTGAAATFNFIFGLGGQLAADGSGNLYTSQFLDDVVRKITPAGVVSTPAGIAGQAGTTDGATGSSLLYYPAGIAADTAGNAYVINKNYPATVDTSFGYVVRKISAAGVTSTLPMTSGDGSSLNAGDDALTVDPSGNIYLVDGNAVLKLNTSGVLTTFAGSSSQAGSSDGTGAAARFNRPSALISDAAGNIYVTDSGNDTIRKITPAGVVTTVAGQVGVPGASDGTGSAASFYAPTAITVDSAGNLYVGDGPATVRKITPAGVVTTIIGVPLQIGITLGNTPTLGPITGVTVVGHTLYVACQSSALMQFPLP